MCALQSGKGACLRSVSTKLCRAGQGRAGQGRAGLGRAGQGSDLRPTSRQVQRVSLVACCVAASPLDITGLISSMKTSHSSYCQKLYTACTSPMSLAHNPKVLLSRRALLEQGQWEVHSFGKMNRKCTVWACTTGGACIQLRKKAQTNNTDRQYTQIAQIASTDR